VNLHFDTESFSSACCHFVVCDAVLRLFADFSGNYGAEPGASVAMPRVACRGNEASLATCPHGSWKDTTCAAGPHAGVKCIGR